MTRMQRWMPVTNINGLDRELFHAHNGQIRFVSDPKHGGYKPQVSSTPTVRQNPQDARFRLVPVLEVP